MLISQGLDLTVFEKAYIVASGKLQRFSKTVELGNWEKLGRE
jgi:hypothetical protein